MFTALNKSQSRCAKKKKGSLCYCFWVVLIRIPVTEMPLILPLMLDGILASAQIYELKLCYLFLREGSFPAASQVPVGNLTDVFFLNMFQDVEYKNTDCN